MDTQNHTVAQKSPVKLPDFDEVTRLLLDFNSPLTLEVHEFIDKGTKVRLLPVMGEKRLDIKNLDQNSLPVIDLKKAGIEVDRSHSTIIAEIKKVLAKRTFWLYPDFSLPEISSIMPEIAGIITMQTHHMRRKYRFRYDTPSDVDLEKELYSPFDQWTNFGFYIFVDEEIHGLDLSKPVEGFVLYIAGFLMPGKRLDLHSATAQAFRLAVKMCILELVHRQLEEKYEQYLIKRKAHWWNRILDWSSFYKVRIKAGEKAFAILLEDFNEAMETAHQSAEGAT